MVKATDRSKYSTVKTVTVELPKKVKLSEVQFT